MYFASERTGGRSSFLSSDRQIWKVPPEGGQPVQLTRAGGFQALESLDGLKLFFAKLGAGRRAGLWNKPASGGPEVLVLPSIFGGRWAVAESGVYFVLPDTSSAPVPLLFFTFGTRRVSEIGRIRQAMGEGLSVSPDEHWIIWAQVDRSESDLVMLENFR